MKILITAGPTREPIDAVRFISNRSSGRMGLALALAAREAGHEVTLLLGPGPREAEHPQGCRVYRFESSAELKQLLEAHFRDHDLLIMAAAVSDYRPRCVADGKLPRDAGRPMVLELDPTPDLVSQVAKSKRPEQKVIAFALEETDRLEARAAEKMRTKDLDAIVANPLGTMESDSITPVLLTASGKRELPGRMTKKEFARWLIGRLSGLIG